MGPQILYYYSHGILIGMQNGKRAKLEAADGNEVDTMFMDKRYSEDIRKRGDVLVRHT